ncbi:MAG: DUF805 domain-containing protein, partial [Maricaulaceae bacterium]
MILNGRTRRGTVFAFIAIVAVAVGVVLFLFGSTAPSAFAAGNGARTAINLLAWVLMAPWLVLCIRRFHDMNYSGWWMLVYVGWMIAGAGFELAGRAFASVLMDMTGTFGLLAFLT